MPYATSTDDVAIYYEVHGSGPAVVLVHGTGGHHAAWWQQVPVLSEQFTVVTLDLRGFGSSAVRTDADGSLDSTVFADDVLSVLRVAGVGPAVLVGQSIGATASLQAALRAPELVAAVVLAHSLGGIGDATLAACTAADALAAKKVPAADRVLTPAFRAAQPAKALLFRQLGTFNTVKRADLRNVDAGPSVGDLRESGLPVCFLTGANDAMLSAATVRVAASLLPGAQLEVVPAAPHAMYWETPALFNAALIRLLQHTTAQHRTHHPTHPGVDA